MVEVMTKNNKKIYNRKTYMKAYIIHSKENNGKILKKLPITYYIVCISQSWKSIFNWTLIKTIDYIVIWGNMYKKIFVTLHLCLSYLFILWGLSRLVVQSEK